MALLATSRELKLLRRILEECRDDVTELKRTSRSLELEFTELYDKVRHQMSRMSKRDAHRVKVDENDEEELPTNNYAVGQDPISQKIFLRRSRGVPQR